LPAKRDSPFVARLLLQSCRSLAVRDRSCPDMCGFHRCVFAANAARQRSNKIQVSLVVLARFALPKHVPPPSRPDTAHPVDARSPWPSGSSSVRRGTRHRRSGGRNPRCPAFRANRRGGLRGESARTRLPRTSFRPAATAADPATPAWPEPACPVSARAAQRLPVGHHLLLSASLRSQLRSPQSGGSSLAPQLKLLLRTTVPWQDWASRPAPR